MSGRVYSVPFNALALSTNMQDLWALTTGSSIACAVEEIRLDPCATSVSEFKLSLALFTSTYTAGSSGSAVTPVRRIKSDAVATTTCKVQNTGQTAIGTGAMSVLDAGQWNLVNGWYWQPINFDHRIIVPVSACFVVSLDSSPGSQTASGCLIFRELS